MAAQTQGAIDALLGLLSTAIKDEAKLIGGVPGNMQFIKDEMDSMNGFLLHLTKTESEHDDQIRAWMKQVREIAYIAEDCVERYVRDIAPHDGDGGLCAFLNLLLLHPKTYLLSHHLGKQILELKVRVHDVGERRQRYGVTVPAASDVKLALKPPGQGEEERREAFRHALDENLGAAARRTQQQAPLFSTFSRAIDLLLLVPAPLPSGTVPAPLPSGTVPAAAVKHPSSSRAIHLPPHPLRSEADIVRALLEKCYQDLEASDEEGSISCMKMFLCSLWVYPYTTNLELMKLSKKLGEEGRETKKEVMIYCYSMLSTQQKSCLQYVTAFLKESEISRTSLVRRWVAEGLFGKEQQGSTTTPEEAGERCFSELVFRCFLRPCRIGDAGTVKSCVLEKSIGGFVTSIAGSENFMVELPAHLQHQLEIRRIVLRSPPLQQQQQQQADCWNIRRNLRNLGRLSRHSAREASDLELKDPMDDLVHFLKSLPELYRLNVLDLGGCRGLKKRHIKSICEVVWLKYLSLRNTDVSRLHARHMKRLTRLETLDIRGTTIPAGDTKRIRLPGLKHLLAGRYLTASGDDAGTARKSAQVEVSLFGVQMPGKIGTKMRNMETLSHVQVSSDGAELGEVARLRRLRKLGVVVYGNDGTARHLRQVIRALAGCLRSLSVWVTQQGGGVLDISTFQEAATSGGLILENLDIMGRISLPSWIARAEKLANVTLRDTEMDGGEALRRLGNVPSLRCLKLSRRSFVVQALNFKDVEFQALKYLVLEGDAITRVAFEADAAPVLEKIVWSIGRVHDGRGLIFGIHHLRNLRVIELRGNFNLSGLSQATAPPTDPSLPTYRCRYVNSFDGKTITELSKTVTDDSNLTLPVGVIN